MIFGPIHTIDRYIKTMINVDFGESTKSHPSVRPSKGIEHIRHKKWHFKLMYRLTEQILCRRVRKYSRISVLFRIISPDMDNVHE